MRKFAIKTHKLWNKAPRIKEEKNVDGIYDNYPRARYEVEKLLNRYDEDMDVYKIFETSWNVWAIILDGEVICIKIEEI